MTMTSTEAAPRIYVASLSDYNAGRLHGVWIDATDDPEDIAEQVRTMLAESPEARAFPEGGPAEEWAIHDYEGFPIALSEWESFDRVHAIATAIAEADDPDAMAAWIKWEEGDPAEPEGFAEAYQGHFDSARDFAEELAGEVGLRNLEPDQLSEIWGLIDWEHVARELTISGDYSFHQATPYGVYVFRADQ